jgi:stringent starvation protein B
MSAPESDLPSASTRPYLIRALYEWCADNGLTPYIAVLADQTVQVPRDCVRDGQIVLNISADATSALALDNDYIRFKARFGGVAREIIIPVDRVMAIYARENGQGMAFPSSEPEMHADTTASGQGQDSLAASDGGIRGNIRLVSSPPAALSSSDGDQSATTPVPPRPTLKRVK